MSGVAVPARGWRAAVAAWDRFWFRPEMPHKLAALRIAAGAMLFYTHLVWSVNLDGFLGKHAWIPRDLSRAMHEGTWSFSYLWYVEHPALLWTLHLAALAVFALLTIGLCTRVVSILALLITLSYCHRLEGSLFGLDQFNTMAAMYLAVGACGGDWSVDAWLRRRRGIIELAPAVSTNVATRLWQIHMCIIYLFGGIGKARGELWWDGFALWYAAANSEYQSTPLTWIIYMPPLMALITHLTVFWETFYIATIWRPGLRMATLGMALLVHLGIAVHMGMITFGLAMIIGNAIFLPQSWFDRPGASAGRGT